MTHVKSGTIWGRWARWGLAVAAIMASPILLVLAVPAIIGLAIDVADLASEREIVLGLSGAVGLALLRRMARRVPGQLASDPLAEAV